MRLNPKQLRYLLTHDQPKSSDFIEHLTFRRTVSVKERICFEIDHYDHHRITQEQAEVNPYIWRSNLLGGGRLVDISQRFQSMQTLAKYIKNNKTWNYGEGFIGEENVAKGRRIEASFLTGNLFCQPMLSQNQGIDEDSN